MALVEVDLHDFEVASIDCICVFHLRLEQIDQKIATHEALRSVFDLIQSLGDAIGGLLTLLHFCG